MDGNLIKFQRNSKKNSDIVSLRLHLLSFQNLHGRYKEKLNILISDLEQENNSQHDYTSIQSDIEMLRKNLQIIEEQINTLAKILD